MSYLEAEIMKDVARDVSKRQVKTGLPVCQDKMPGLYPEVMGSQ